MEQRTTRPRQCTRTSRVVPSTVPGIRREKRISSPTFSGLSISKSTPLAETFRVSAANSPLPLERTTGNASGKRTAHRTSCEEGDPSACACGNGSPIFIAFIIDSSHTAMSLVVTLSQLFSKSHGTKVFRMVTQITLQSHAAENHSDADSETSQAKAFTILCLPNP